MDEYSSKLIYAMAQFNVIEVATQCNDMRILIDN